MTGEGHAESDDDSLKQWRQGDFALAVGGFLFAGLPDRDDDFDAREESEGVVGLVAISQTCDIVRRTGGRHYMTVCPLIQVGDLQLPEVRRGRRPYFAEVENTGETVFADLRRVMSVEKNLVRRWNRQDGFSSEQGRIRSAAALERKFGQFAFPDDFDRAIAKFRERVWSRHSKGQSLPGKVYRSLIQIRFRAVPDWSVANREISMIAVMWKRKDREATREEIHQELRQELAKIVWPTGYQWGDPDLLLGTAIELSAEDMMSSQRADFDYLCY
ncbi:MAG: hypothetical protein OXE40_15015 [Gammaproteobacteria bacterium]|nr:hypothetical protein [Gammaproteobacteria bacterium]